MSQLFRALYQGDVFSLLLIAGVLYVVRRLLTQDDPILVRFCQRAWYATFLGFAALAWWRLQPWNGNQVATLLFRSLIAATIGSGVAGLIGPIFRAGQRFIQSVQARHRNAIAAREWKKREARECEERERERLRAHELALLQQERQRASAVESASRQRIAAGDEQRRLRARAQCDLFFKLHRADFGSRFTRRDLEDFMQKYLSESQSPEFVESHAAELLQIMEQHLVLVGAKKQPTTIAQLTEWYRTEREQLLRVEIDEEIKETHLIQLDMRYSELSQELLESMKP